MDILAHEKQGVPFALGPHYVPHRLEGSFLLLLRRQFQSRIFRADRHRHQRRKQWDNSVALRRQIVIDQRFYLSQFERWRSVVSDARCILKMPDNWIPRAVGMIGGALKQQCAEFLVAEAI